ncbi:TlpA family protein disulfide reductase [bacterium]|nr:TlpA family protein disulfide reductase [bacterium]
MPTSSKRVKSCWKVKQKSSPGTIRCVNLTWASINRKRMIEPTPQKNNTNHPPKRALVWVLVGMGAVGLLLWLAVMVMGGLNLRQTAASGEEQAPELDFTVKKLDGSPVALSSLRGQVVLVNFWATWCTPCKEEMPLLQAYYDAHKEDGFVLVGINVSDDVEDAQAFISQYGYTFPVWSDAAGNVLIDLNMNGLPASLVVDAQGRLVKRWIGPLAQEDLDQVITPLLGLQ